MNQTSPTPVGLIASLPPQVGGVASVAEWLLDHEQEIGCSYSAFDLIRPLGEEMGGRFRLAAVPRQVWQLGRFLLWLRRSPAVVHYCMATSRYGLPRDALYVLLLRLFGRRTIAHIHGSSLPAAIERKVRSRLLRLIGRFSSERVAISPTAQRLLGTIGISSRCILNPIRFEPGGTVDEPIGSRNGTSVRLLFVGAFGRRKGCPELIDAVARVRERGIDVKLRIVGNEDRRGDAETLTAMVDSHRLQTVVEFAGVKSADEMPDVYRGADLICLPSWFEGLPMALLEGMSFGLPVVATTAGGIPDLVQHGRTGLLVDAGDVDALAGAIADLARDSARRSAMGAKGRERVLDLVASPAIAAQWRALYGELATRA